MDVLDLVSLRLNHFHAISHGKETGFDNKAGTKYANSAGRASGKLFDERVKDVQHRQGRYGEKFPNAQVRRHCPNHSQIRFCRLQAIDNAS